VSKVATKKKRQKVKSLDPSELPDLPEGWSWVTLHDLAAPEPNSITDGPFGSKLKTSHYTNEGPRVLRLQNVGDGEFVDAMAHISEEHFETLSKHHIYGGDVLIAALGETLPRSCIVPDWIGPALVKADCPRFKPNPDLTNAHYVNFALNSPGIRKRAANIIHGVGRPRLNLGEIRGTWIPLAPLNEQKQIVSKIEELFSDLDAGVAALKRAQANLRRYRASVLKSAVEGRLTAAWRSANPGVEPASELLARILRERRQRWEQQQLATYESKGKKPPKNWQSKYKEPAAPDTANLSELPNGWCWTTIDAIGEVVGGITKGQKRKTEEGLVEVPYLRVANVQRGYLDLSKIKTIQARASELERYRLQPGDILFNEGGDRDKLGRGWVWEGQIEDCIHQNHVFRVRFVLPEMNSEFLSHHGNTFGRLWFLRTGKQSVNLASINMTVLRKFPVPLAPLSEQSAIIDFAREKLSSINRTLELIEKNLARSDRLRQTILKSAFDGSLINHTAVQTEKELNACST
jgi:type I restriction enzyme S subunit